MYNYCTLFDSHYLIRGVTMYESLLESTQNFHLYIFAFDDRSLDTLNKLKLLNTTIVSLHEFEDDELFQIKSTRSPGEYCWTCTPSIIKYAIEKYNLTSCTYLDADLYFFRDPSILIEEMGNKSVLITEHRYTSQYDQSRTSGIYCVQFMTFKNDSDGMKVLEWWRKACNKWCYARFEDGKFGDQKYLDDWTGRFDGVHVLENINGGVAPWNIQQYDIPKLMEEIIFYHFHGVKFYRHKINLNLYKLTKQTIKMIYKPYIEHIEKIKDKVSKIDISYTECYDKEIKKNWKYYPRILRDIIKNTYNMYTLEYIRNL